MSRISTNELNLKGKQLTTEQVVDLLNRRSNSKAADEISFDIDRVDFNQIQVLDLSFNKLTRVPADVIHQQFPYLQTLKLDNNSRILPNSFNDVLEVAQLYTALDLSIDNLTDDNIIQLQLTNPNLNIINTHLDDNQSEHDVALQLGTSTKPTIAKEQHIVEIGQFFARIRTILKEKLDQVQKEKDSLIKHLQRTTGYNPPNFYVDNYTTGTMEKFQSFYDELIQTVRNNLDAHEDEEQRRSLIHQAKVFIYHQHLDLLYVFGSRTAREKQELMDNSKPKTSVIHDEDITATFNNDLPSSPKQIPDESVKIQFSLHDIRQQAKLVKRDLVDTNILDWDQLHHRSTVQTPIDVHNVDDDIVIPSYHDGADPEVKEYNLTGVLFRSKETKASMISEPVWKRVILFIAQFLPIVQWFPEYFKKDAIFNNLKGDILAGVTVAIVIIPQGIAYALVAGMPPMTGLYTCWLPNLIYPFFGTSRQLSPGPSAIVSLLLSSAITTLNPSTEEEFINYGILLCLLSSGMYFLLGFFRMGFIVNFMSKPVISGFTSASAIAIGLTQVKYVLGIHPQAAKGTQIYYALYVLGKSIFTPAHDGHDNGIHWPSAGCSILFVIMLLFFTYGFIPLGKGRRFYPGHIIPGQLVVIMFSISWFYLMSLGDPNLDGHSVFGINVLGTVPKGLPAPKIPTFYKFVADPPNVDNSTQGEHQAELLNFGRRLLSNINIGDETGTVVTGHYEGSGVIDQNTLLACMLISVTVVIVGFSEAYSVAKFYSNQNNYRVDANQELIALGICGIAAGFFRAYPSSTSFSRSAVNAQVGARTQMASFITGLMMFLVLTVITPLFYFLPKPLLGSLIILAVAKLVDFRTVMITWHTKRRDTVMLAVAFFATMLLGVEWGIVVAVFMSLALVIFRSARPRFVEVGRMPGTTDYASIKRYSSAVTIPHVLVMRFDSDLSFTNVAYFMEKIERYLERATKRGNDTVVYVLDMGGVNQLDSSGVDGLHQMKSLFDTLMIRWHFANTKIEIMRIMTRGGLIGEHEGEISESSFYHTLHDAVLQAKQVVKDRVVQGEEMNHHHGHSHGGAGGGHGHAHNVVIEEDDILAQRH
ncbi:sulfate transporter sulP [Acrasis kona]|uniref:Sulfate transporter sulP n=1 Tax=Acrasis kona TaxID=1008807 RepID=A0AAW2Z8L7_9EUKA